VHEAQPWRLAYWRLARESLTYRRFFEIADLVGVRIEQPQVFADVHRLALRLVAEGRVDGLRVDHVDGLARPKQYLDALREAGAPDYVLVEKILAPEEELPAGWATAGTTGYEVARLITGLQVDATNAEAMTAAWTSFTGADPDYDGQVLEAKRRTLRYNLASELERLTATASRIAATDLTTRDFGADALMRAIVEIAVALPVYRTYIDADGASDEDRRLVEDAVAAAKASRQTEDDRVPAFIGRLLLAEARTPDVAAFVGHFQQATGPLTAKAVEDTLFYRFNRLIALNEVGAEPDRFGVAPEDFHAAMRRRAERAPAALSATATHDTKRGEDARARIAVLSEMPRQWAAAVDRWHAALQPAVEPELEWLFYQSLLGAWPVDLALDDGAALADLAGRLDGFMIKALREAKIHSSWTEPNQAFEAEVGGFVRSVLSPDSRGLLADFERTFRPILTAGFVNSLAQLALKLTLPGIPDIYQGTELFDLSLVDPDNRRPVDFESRAALLQQARGMDAADTIPRWRQGLPKLWLLARLLALRSAEPAVFADGDYQPLAASGPAAGHVVAFARRHRDRAVVTVVPRLPLALLGNRDLPHFEPADFAETRLALPSDLRVHDMPGELAVGQLLSGFPVRVLSATAGAAT
jgi:(1->4)-alpha-D-glucan 1-alpha-D-glucosylmutase